MRRKKTNLTVEQIESLLRNTREKWKDAKAGDETGLTAGGVMDYCDVVETLLGEIERLREERAAILKKK